MDGRGVSTDPWAVRVAGLSFAYDEGGLALEDISFGIAPGEAVVVAGLSGAGKTTLCQCLAGLAPKAIGGTLTGSVQIGGEDVAPLPLPQLASRIGFVFQDPDNQLITTTVEDELAFAAENLAVDPAEIRRRVDRQLERFGLRHLALRAPNELSGGEKHLVAIASVLVLDPPVVIVDEPFTHLDDHGRAVVLAALLDLQREGRTLVVVEHDLTLTTFADRYLVLDGGRLVAVTGSPPPELLDEPLGDVLPFGGAVS